MIPLGQELKAWAITVSGYGTILETSDTKVTKQVEHYRGRGHDVVVTEMGPAAATAAPKPKLLQWHELEAGDYQAFPFVATDVEVDPNEGSTIVRVTDCNGSLYIDGIDGGGSLDEKWGKFQYLQFPRTNRSDVEFQPENLTPADDDDEE